MTAETLHDRDEIEAFLRGDPGLHVYGIGDLEEPYWQKTIWFGNRGNAGLDAVVFVYYGGGTPVLLAFESRRTTGNSPAGELLRAIHPILPPRFYGHVSGHLHPALTDEFAHKSNGMHDKMLLTSIGPVSDVDTSEAVPLTPDDDDEVARLLAEAYPGNWFDPWMLETGKYRGIRRSGRLVAAGGVHVFAPRRGVAALGNVATDPEFRRRGHGRTVLAAITQALLDEVDLIGLNVGSDNDAAIACYEQLGFEKVARYLEGAYTSVEDIWRGKLEAGS